MNDLCPVRAPRQTMLDESQPPTASAALLSFVNKRRLCDVTFTFKNSTEKVLAHQLCLRSRSPVFDTMFHGRGSFSRMAKLKVKDVSPSVFKKFVEFIYYDKLDVNPPEVLHLLHLGKKYKVQPLIAKCQNLLDGKIPTASCVETYETADHYGIIDVRDKALGVILSSFETLLQDEQMLRAQETTLLELLVRDDLKVREVELFRFLIRWGQKASTNTAHLPRVLARLLPKLRYTNMTSMEFADVVVPTNLIATDHVAKIYNYLNSNKYLRATQRLHFEFSTSCRCGKLEEKIDFYENLRIHEADADENAPWCVGTEKLAECISFKVLGRTSSGFSCNKHTKLELKCIKIKLPSLILSSLEDISFNVVLLQKSPKDGQFQQILEQTVNEYEFGCLTEVRFDSAIEILHEAKYCIAVIDASYHGNRVKDRDLKYQYIRNDSVRDGALKSSTFCFKNVEIRNLRKNNCRSGAHHRSYGYEDLNVIRGMHLEFTEKRSA